MTSISIIAAEGDIAEIHQIALGECPYLYAYKRVIQDRKAGLTHKYRIEYSGQKSCDLSEDEVVATAAQIYV
jgi:hypothetical protein